MTAGITAPALQLVARQRPLPGPFEVPARPVLRAVTNEVRLLRVLRLVAAAGQLLERFELRRAQAAAQVTAFLAEVGLRGRG